MVKRCSRGRVQLDVRKINVILVAIEVFRYFFQDRFMYLWILQLYWVLNKRENLVLT